MAVKSGVSIGLVLGGLVASQMFGVGARDSRAQSEYAFKLYGYAKLNASYDTQRTQAGNLMFYVLPESEAGRQEEFNMTARESRIGMHILAPEYAGATIAGRAEIDFYSGASENSPNPRLRLAYVDMARGDWSLRAGQDWETFISVLPRIVNFAYLADAGALGLRRPQLRVTKVTRLGEQMRLTSKLAAARTIGEDLDGAGQDDGAASGYPSVQGNVALQAPTWTERPMVVSVSGHAGRETVSTYKDETNPDAPVLVEEEDYDSWSAIGSLVLPLTGYAMLQGTLWTGENLDTYYGGIGQGVNLARQRVIGSRGGWVQCVLDPTDRVHVNLGYGEDSPEAEDLEAGQRSRNEVWFGNVFFELTPSVTVAAEYAYMDTAYKERDSASNHRIQSFISLDF